MVERGLGDAFLPAVAFPGILVEVMLYALGYSSWVKIAIVFSWSFVRFVYVYTDTSLLVFWSMLLLDDYLYDCTI